MARKRKIGRRHPNGKLVQPTGYEIKRPVLERRCLKAGLKPTHENLKQADRAGATLWGHYWLAGFITERQFDAAGRFAVLRDEYRKAMSLPPETARSANLLAAGGRSVVSGWQDTKPPELAMYDALRGAVGDTHLSTLVALSVGMLVRTDALLPALDAAADWFRV